MITCYSFKNVLLAIEKAFLHRHSSYNAPIQLLMTLILIKAEFGLLRGRSGDLAVQAGANEYLKGNTDAAKVDTDRVPYYMCASSHPCIAATGLVHPHHYLNPLP